MRLFSSTFLHKTHQPRLLTPSSIVDPDPFYTDPDPAFHFDTDLDPVFQPDRDPDPAV